VIGIEFCVLNLFNSAGIFQFKSEIRGGKQGGGEDHQ